MQDTQSQSRPPAIAVLPFRNLGADSTLDYLSEGISEEIIHNLTRLGNIRVASRTSSFYFKNKTTSPEEIGQKLRVNYLLEGSVRVSGKKVRISAQLTNTKNGFLLWSENFDRALRDTLNLQDEIAHLVAEKFLKVTVFHLQESPSKTIQLHQKAYDNYLKGLYYYNQYTMENLKKAIVYYEKATQYQQDYANAFAGLAICYMGLGGYINPTYYQKAKTYALKALSLDHQLIAPHLSLTAILMVYEWDLETAYNHIQEALKINPFSADAHRMYGIYFLRKGNVQNAIYEHELAIKYDPLNTIYLRGLGLFQSFVKKYKEALRYHEYTLEIDPNFHPAYEAIGWLFVYQNNWEKAIQYFQKYQKMVGHPLKGWAALGYAYGKTGHLEKAHNILNTIRLRQITFPNEQLDCNFALVYLGLNNLDKMFFHLNLAIEKRHILTSIFLPNDPIYNELKHDPRYLSLLEKLKIFIPEKKKLTKKTRTQIIHLQAETKETLSILQNHLLYIEAKGNYTKIVWKEGAKLTFKMLRISLSKLQKQIHSKEFFLCHRSYLVNLSHFQTIEGNAKKCFLIAPDILKKIPISRAKISEVKKRLNLSL